MGGSRQTGCPVPRRRRYDNPDPARVAARGRARAAGAADPGARAPRVGDASSASLVARPRARARLGDADEADPFARAQPARLDGERSSTPSSCCRRRGGRGAFRGSRSTTTSARCSWTVRRRWSHTPAGSSGTEPTSSSSTAMSSDGANRPSSHRGATSASQLCSNPSSSTPLSIASSLLISCGRRGSSAPEADCGCGLPCPVSRADELLKREECGSEVAGERLAPARLQVSRCLVAERERALDPRPELGRRLHRALLGGALLDERQHLTDRTSEHLGVSQGRWERDARQLPVVPVADDLNPGEVLRPGQRPRSPPALETVRDEDDDRRDYCGDGEEGRRGKRVGPTGHPPHY